MLLFSFAFKLADLPAFGVIVLLAMLCIPLLLFHVGMPMRRAIEILWFAILIWFLASAWLFWSADYCGRITSDRLTPAIVGAAVLISIATIVFSAVPRWRIGKCLAGHSLHPTILMIFIQLVFFGIVSTAIGFATLKLVLGGSKLAFGPIGFPNWLWVTVLSITLLIQILINLSTRKYRVWFYRELSERLEVAASGTDESGKDGHR